MWIFSSPASDSDTITKRSLRQTGRQTGSHKAIS